MPRPELLAPAGSMQALIAAVNGGANAVYLGCRNFSARAFAVNFSDEELIEAVRYAHLHDVKIYVTINTLLDEFEFANALKTVDFCYEHDVDALLIQDLGLYYAIKNKYPDFELHCSTQMHVHNIEGIRTAKRLGFKRVVVARESTIDFIRQACRQKIEIETFVHGAICVSYSGQCLMSSSSKNRSANKGMCAQCCRLRYELYDEDNRKINTNTPYLLSPKDMFLLEDLPELIRAGVSSFKIEGRMKSPAYVYYVTKIYRQAIDAYYQNKEFKVSEEELKDLKVLFNRGFTNDLLYGRNGLFGQLMPNHQGIEIGDVCGNSNDETFIRLSDDLHQFDGIRIEDFGCNVNMLYKDGLLVSEGKKGDVVSIRADRKLNGKVYKTQDYLLEKKVQEMDAKKEDLCLDIDVRADHKVTVRLSHKDQSMEYVSDIVAQKALKTPLSELTIERQFSKLNDTIYYPKKIIVNTDEAFLPIGQLNEIRRSAISTFDDYRLNSFKRESIYAEYEVSKIEENPSTSEMIKENEKLYYDDQEYDIAYVINRDSVYPSGDNALICEFGGLLKEYGSKIAYFTLNCSNSWCYEFFRKIGFEKIILSSELNEAEILKLVSEYEKRNGEKIRPYVLKNGRRVLMYIVSDPFGKYLKKDRQYYLKDGFNRYEIRKNEDITELIETDHRRISDNEEAYGSLYIRD